MVECGWPTEALCSDAQSRRCVGSLSARTTRRREVREVADLSGTFSTWKEYELGTLYILESLVG